MSTICVFGASITWGAFDDEKGGWVERLKTYFWKSDNDFYNLGISGDKSTDLLKRFKAECKAREPNVILISIGINDSQYINDRNNPRTPIGEFKDNIQKLIEIGQAFTGKIIFVGLNPVDESKTMPIPWSPEKYYTNENIQEYNNVVKSICEENNLSFIEIFDNWMKSDYKNLLEDGLHPNSKGHKKIFETVNDFLIQNKIIKI